MYVLVYMHQHIHTCVHVCVKSLKQWCTNTKTDNNQTHTYLHTMSRVITLAMLTQHVIAATGRRWRRIRMFSRALSVDSEPQTCSSFMTSMTSMKSPARPTTYAHKPHIQMPAYMNTYTHAHTHKEMAVICVLISPCAVVVCYLCIARPCFLQEFLAHIPRPAQALVLTIPISGLLNLLRHSVFIMRIWYILCVINVMIRFYVYW